MLQIVIVRDQHGYWIKEFNAETCVRDNCYPSLSGVLKVLARIIPQLVKQKNL